MPMIYLKAELYDAIVKRGERPAKFTNDAVEEKLKKEVDEKNKRK